ncbi:Asp23/Gls24 family envelope stress response protein [Psychromicrobium lacuslunae]|uniref:Asp23/Gls24 family envelope stress response protein n=1 Tax=Psychromicrobium lacuslunae TaxID=1618207 RepID=A0A0D4C264_9MICC|nr:Asp23/Gls24 family envelope stress response protein [Psychromicrobium lacuslunae]AJT42624.1 hypothetical protein UM93_16160 [Psychromicrobium lacuslunae]
MSARPEMLSCGHSLDELSDYLAADRQPANPYIDTCPECQSALRALEQLNSVTRELIDFESEPHSAEDENWLGSIFSNIALEAQAGRDIPLHNQGELPAADPDDELSQTEGSVIALIRSAGDELEGAMIGRCRLEGEVSSPDAEITVEVRLSAVWGPPLPALADELRTKIRETLERHTQLKISAINIAIVDIQRSQTLGDGD